MQFNEGQGRNGGRCSHDACARVGGAAGMAGLSRLTPPCTRSCPWWRSPPVSTGGSRRWAAWADPCANTRAWSRRAPRDSSAGTASGSRAPLGAALRRLSCLRIDRHWCELLREYFNFSINILFWKKKLEKRFKLSRERCISRINILFWKKNLKNHTKALPIRNQYYISELTTNLAWALHL